MSEPLPGGAACARHPAALAVEVCARCGAFACEACVDYLEAGTPVCEPCRALLVRASPSLRGRVGAWAAGLGVLGMLVGLRVPGRPGLWWWAAAAPLGLVGAVLSALELRRLRRAGSAAGAGERVARLGLGLGVAHGALVALLAGMYLAFLAFRQGSP